MLFKILILNLKEEMNFDKWVFDGRFGIEVGVHENTRKYARERCGVDIIVGRIA